MQTSRRISLNAVRIFSLVARTGSLTETAEEIGVTSSAISHQIKKLEGELGVSLFKRGNNSITPTDAGRRFYEEIAPAIALIDRSVEALYRDENEIVVDVSMSLAMRWLIPALQQFHATHPSMRVRIDTSPFPEASAGSLADVIIRYVRWGEANAGERLAEDLSLPVAAPALLKGKAITGVSDFHKIPALKCARNNWDWKRWCVEVGLPFEGMTIPHEFDTDDAALHAAVAGLGMVLASPLLIAPELRSGTLVVVPGSDPVELGHYELIIGRPETRAVRQFCKWLRRVARQWVTP